MQVMQDAGLMRVIHRDCKCCVRDAALGIPVVSPLTGQRNYFLVHVKASFIVVR